MISDRFAARRKTTSLKERALQDLVSNAIPAQNFTNNIFSFSFSITVLLLSAKQSFLS